MRQEPGLTKGRELGRFFIGNFPFLLLKLEIRKKVKRKKNPCVQCLVFLYLGSNLFCWDRTLSPSTWNSSEDREAGGTSSLVPH
jgi:hypothetical protein